MAPITHLPSDMAFGPATSGAFYPGQADGSQTAYTVTLPWVAIPGRSHADGDWAFLIIATGDHFDSYDMSRFGSTILRAFRLPHAGTDLILVDAGWSGQGVWEENLRVISVAGHHLTTMQTSMSGSSLARMSNKLSPRTSTVEVFVDSWSMTEITSSP